MLTRLALFTLLSLAISSGLFSTENCATGACPVTSTAAADDHMGKMATAAMTGNQEAAIPAPAKNHEEATMPASTENQEAATMPAENAAQ